MTYKPSIDKIKIDLSDLCKFKNGWVWHRIPQDKYRILFRIRGYRKGNSYKRDYLHRHIMKCPKGSYVDHINGNPLDNRKCNLRICDSSQNQGNRRKNTGPHLPFYKGLSLSPNKKKWVASIMYNYKKLYLGSYDTEIEAAQAYNKKAIELFREYAKLNEV